ncbi:MAG: hypothetical protein AB7U18_26275 [Dehalococcoidia bacterium]
MDDKRVDREERATAADDGGDVPPLPQPVAEADDAAPPTPALSDPPTTEGAAQSAPPAATPPRRALKLVVTLRPDDRAGYRAILALGVEGCDPVLRSGEAADLPAALDQVPALLTEADARWQVQPRNRSAPPLPAKARPVASGRQTAPRIEPAPAESVAADDDAPASNEQPARAGQLSLFGSVDTNGGV